MSKAMRINSILGYKDYSHSDFTSIMLGNVKQDDTTWARYIGGRFAIFEAPGRTGHQSRGYSGDWDEALNVVSNYGKIGLSVDSATGSMVGSRDVSYQAIFSLRGKPENMYGRKKTALFEIISFLFSICSITSFAVVESFSIQSFAP